MDQVQFNSIAPRSREERVCKSHYSFNNGEGVNERQRENRAKEIKGESGWL